MSIHTVVCDKCGNIHEIPIHTEMNVKVYYKCRCPKCLEPNLISITILPGGNCDG